MNGSSMQSQPQVIVVGGGPAGATTATILAQQGVAVRLYERQRFPRFHIGESLMPETYWTFKRLGVLEKLRSSQHVKKYSVQFVNDAGKESQPFYFFSNREHECSQTWQVVRSEFDAMMLDNAAAHGVEVCDQVRVLEVLFDDNQRATGVRIQHDDGRKEEVSAQVVVDASGQSSLIANRLHLREPDPILKKASVWAYYEGASRECGVDEGATLVLSTAEKKGWFWYIPLHSDTVSIGVVSSPAELFANGSDLEAIFAEQLEKCPAAAQRIAGARRKTSFFTTKDFSYYSKQVAGDGWVLVGDAFGFPDPIYSSGVFLALKSGEWAADAIAQGLAHGDLSGDQLGNWGPLFLEGLGRMRRLVYAFYEGFNFGRFIRKYPHCQQHVIDLLIGDLFKPSVDEVFGPMEELMSEPAEA